MGKSHDGGKPEKAEGFRFGNFKPGSHAEK